MSYQTAKVVLLVALVALGLSPLATKAQQREAKQEAEAREKVAQQSARKEQVRKEEARREAAKKKEANYSGPDKEPNHKKTALGERAAKERLSITPEREAAVMTFVKRNHAELAQLLAHLKDNQPKEYERAIRELFRTSERLTQIHDRDLAQYDLELRLWKTQSRIQLLTARLQMGDSEDLKQELSELLGEQVDNRVALLRHDREKVAARLARIDEDLKRLEADRQKVIDRQLQSLTNAGKATRPAGKTESGRGTKNSTTSSQAKRGSKAVE